MKKSLLKHSRKPSFFSIEPVVSHVHGASRLLPLLEWTAKTNAPYFNAGNILFHGISSAKGVADREIASFRKCIPSAPGLHHTSLFPVTNAQCTNDRLADETAKVTFFKNGKELVPEWIPEGRHWTPTQLRDGFRCGDFHIAQRTAVLSFENADVLECELEFQHIPDSCEMKIDGNFFRPCEMQEGTNGILYGTVTGESPDFHFSGGPWNGQTPPTTAVGSCFAIFTDFSPEKKLLSGKPGETYQLSGPLSKSRIRIYFSAGFTQNEITHAIMSAREHADDFFRLADRPLERYFAETVPQFTCSDKALERVYAELSVTGFLSTIDLGYEPYHYPFTCPSAKIFSPWRMQFYHDSTFSGRSYLWLNDEKRCMDDLLQMITVQYVHSSPRLGDPFPNQIDCMPLVFNMLPQAAMEFYRRTGDLVFLRSVYEQFLRFDRNKCRPEHSQKYEKGYREAPDFTWLFPFHHFDSDGDWLVESQLSGDDTCRGDEFAPGTKAKTWWDRPDPAVEPADINFYVLGNRMALREMAELFHEPDVCEELDEAIKQQRSAIERTMWDENARIYSDVTEKEHQRSHVLDAQNITVPLYGRCVSPEHAKDLVKKIFDPEVFGTPMALPSCPVNYTGLNGKKGFRPTGYWRGLSWGVMHYEAVLGLAHYGYRQEAAFLLHRFFDALKRSDLPAPENFNPLNKNAVGTPFMGFSTQMLHPFLTFVTGLKMDAGNDLEFDPLALNPDWDEFSFGPFRYRPGIELTMTWKKDSGYHVRVNRQDFHFPVPTAFRLMRKDETYVLDEASVRPLKFDAVSPVSCELLMEDGKLTAELTNHSDSISDGELQPRILTLDKGLRPLKKSAFCIDPKSQIRIPICHFMPDDDGSQWVLAEIRIKGFPIAFSEGFGAGTEILEGK